MFSKILSAIGLSLFLFISTVQADVETEPNNSIEAADVLTVSTSMEGQMMSEQDEDWFYMEISSADTLDVVFSGCDYCYDCWKIIIQDSSGVMLASFDAKNNGNTNFQVGVSKADTYYFTIKSGNRYDSSSYSLTVSAQNSLPGGKCTPEQLKDEYDKGYQAGINACSQGIYTQVQVDQMVQNILAWGDTNGDNKIGLIEAINALQITSGVKQ